MTIATFVLAGAVLALAAVVLWLVLRQGRVLSGRTVTLNTRRPDDQTLRGVLVGWHRDRLTLRDACYLGQAGREEPIVGPVHVPLENVAFVQEH